MPVALQAKLLRVLQEGEFERLGSSTTIKVDVRVIVATSRDLMQDVQEGRFREDLFYRLNVFPILIPPLRERTQDVPLLIQHFIEKYARKMSKQIDRLPKRVLVKMINYAWPGNVRELEHLIERLVILTTGSSLAINDQLFNLVPEEVTSDKLQNLQSVEREHIIKILDHTGWTIEGASWRRKNLRTTSKYTPF